MKANRPIDGIVYFDEVRGDICMDEDDYVRPY